MDKNPLFFKITGLKLDGLKCVCCEYPLDGHTVWGYPHEGGIEVGKQKLWLYAVCKRCSYQNSLRKLLPGLQRLDHKKLEVVNVWVTSQSPR